MTFWIAVGVGIIGGIGAVILVEIIGRRFFDFKKSLVAEYDPLRDGDTDAYLDQLRRDWPELDQQEATRRMCP